MMVKAIGAALIIVPYLGILIVGIIASGISAHDALIGGGIAVGVMTTMAAGVYLLNQE